MSKVELMPKMKTFKKGTLINCDQPIMAYGSLDEASTTDDIEEEWIEKDSTFFFVEDKQFIEQRAVHIKAKIVTANGHIAWVTLFDEQKRQWDFRTLRGRKKIVAAVLDARFTEIDAGEKQ